MVLTKKEIIDGIDATETVKIKALDGEVELRLLSQSELFQLDAFESKALGVLKTSESGSRGKGRNISKSELSSQSNIDVHKLTVANQNAKLKAVQWALSIGDTKWTEQEVSDLTGPVFNEIYENVQRMNHFGEGNSLEKDVDSFH